MLHQQFPCVRRISRPKSLIPLLYCWSQIHCELYNIVHALTSKKTLSISFLQNSNWLNFTDVNSCRLTLIFGKLNKGFKQKISPEFKVSHNNGLQTGLQWHWSLQTGFEARRRPNKAIAVTVKSSSSHTYHILIDCEFYFLLAICRKTKDQMRKDVVKAIIQNSHLGAAPVISVRVSPTLLFHQSLYVLIIYFIFFHFSAFHET